MTKRVGTEDYLSYLNVNFDLNRFVLRSVKPKVIIATQDPTTLSKMWIILQILRKTEHEIF
jgi:hypothetical protein